MPAPNEPRKVPGLASIHKAREDRTRGRFNRPGAAGFAYVGLALVVILLGYRFFSGRALDEQRSALLGKRRAAESELGTRWAPLRDQIEAVTLDAAKAYKGDFVAKEAVGWDFRNQPGIYLRLRVADAKDVASLRRAAQESAKDGFTSCLLRTQNQAGLMGVADGGAAPDQPWNLRQGYAATRILSEEWANEVRASEDELRLRVFEQQYDKAVREEIPMAFDIVTRAKFFLLVLDEDVEEAKELADGGVITEEALQLVGHPSRIHLVNLKTGEEVLRLQRSGEASFVFAGERAISDEETRQAMQRQVNNCALATQVRQALTDANGAGADGGTKADPGAKAAGAK